MSAPKSTGPTHHRWPIIAGVLLLPVLYVLSEAPLVRLTGQVPHGGGWRVYEPADWLFDETPLQEPLLRWIDLWDVDLHFIDAELERRKDEGCIVAPDPAPLAHR